MAQDGNARLPLILSAISLLVAILAAVFSAMQAVGTVAQAGVNTAQLVSELNRQNELAEEATREDWQQFVVFSTIDKKFSANEFKVGVGIDEIKTGYLQEATVVKDVALTKDNLQQAELDRILLKLIANGLIYRTYDGKYATNVSELLPMFGRLSPLENACYFVVGQLHGKEDGMTEADISKLIADRFKLSNSECAVTLNLLIKDKWIVRNGDGRFFAAATPPSNASNVVP